MSRSTAYLQASKILKQFFKDCFIFVSCDVGWFHPTSLFLAVSYFQSMYRIVIALSFLILKISVADAQTITGLVRGKITESTGLPLAGATVTINEVVTTTNDAGDYALSVTVGRHTFKVTYTGYSTHQSELLVTAGKVVDFNVSLKVSQTLLAAVDVTAQNADVDLAGVRSLTIEKSLRFPANFFDPVRVITSYPGVMTANDQNNSIIIRGNSPNGLLWRLNGLDIVNPNHLANAGTLSDKPVANGGGVNILSAQMLGRTDFFTGFKPATYGNVLSGVIDMELLDGNKTDYEFTAQASLIGIDLAAEGPIKKGRTSFLANYRYSTVGLLSLVGVNFGDEEISFQDFSFSTNTDLTERSNLALFGFGGASTNVFNAKNEDEWTEEKDRYDIDYDAQTYGVGLNFSTRTDHGRLSIGAAYSNSDQDRSQNAPRINTGFEGIVNDEYHRKDGVLSTKVSYDFKIATGTILSGGFMANVINNTRSNETTTLCEACSPSSTQTLKGDVDGSLFQPYLALNTALTEKFSLYTGLRFLYYTFNDSKSIEPRVSLNFGVSESTSMILSYSLISQLQQAEIYLQEQNAKLGMTRSNQVDFQVLHQFGEGLNWTSNLYYQRMNDVPVKIGSTFSAINYQDGAVPADLLNGGSAVNYGIETTVEKLFLRSHYFLIGGSLYNSTFETFEGEKFDTRFNGQYTFNAVYGKEWFRSSRNRTIGINTRVLYLGGLRESAIDVEQSQLSGRTVYDEKNPYSEKLDDYFRVDFRISFRKDKPGYTRTFAIDIQNLLNIENAGYHYYDMFRHETILKKQLGTIPVLVYRIDF